MWPFSNSPKPSNPPLAPGKYRKAQYGWSPDIRDLRDAKVPQKLRAAAPTFLPRSVDLRPQCPPVVEQGALGSCTANALAGVLAFLEMKARLPLVPKSRLFIYYNERAADGTVRSDAGSQLRTGIKVVAKQGACAETLWPYDIKKFENTPPTIAYTQGMKNVITQYWRLDGLADMRACLSQGYPFVFGFTVFDSFESLEMAKSGIAQMPLLGEPVIGGHAVMAVGYDDTKGVLIVRNSWGPLWGQAGYFTLPYGYIEQGLAQDFWSISKAMLGN